MQIYMVAYLIKTFGGGGDFKFICPIQNYSHGKYWYLGGGRYLYVVILPIWVSTKIFAL